MSCLSGNDLEIRSSLAELNQLAREIPSVTGGELLVKLAAARIHADVVCIGLSHWYDELRQALRRSDRPARASDDRPSIEELLLTIRLQLSPLCGSPDRTTIAQE